MKKLLITAAATMLAFGCHAHGDEAHAATAPRSGAEANGGHDHTHTHTHTHSLGHADPDADFIGTPGQAAKVTRTVKVDMTDAMRFNPASITARQSETIRFTVRNAGQVKHEFVLGTEKELKEHYELMKKFPEMEHSDPNMVTVAPGRTGEVIWQFTKAGKIDFACLQPGHYDAGMKGAVNVRAVKGSTMKADGHGDHKH